MRRSTCKYCTRNAVREGCCVRHASLEIRGVRKTARGKPKRKREKKFKQEVMPNDIARQFREMRKEVIPVEGGTLCARCARSDIPQSAEIVDHVRPYSLYPELALYLENMQPLCFPCHNKKSALQQHGRCYDYLRGRVFHVAKTNKRAARQRRSAAA